MFDTLLSVSQDDLQVAKTWHQQGKEVLRKNLNLRRVNQLMPQVENKFDVSFGGRNYNPKGPHLEISKSAPNLSGAVGGGDGPHEEMVEAELVAVDWVAVVKAEEEEEVKVDLLEYHELHNLHNLYHKYICFV